MGSAGRRFARTTAGVKKLIDKMTADDDWFPGKVYGSLGGRPPVLSETNKSIIAGSAMAMKERGIEPTYALIIAQCPNASTNPSSGEPVSKQVVYDILENRCYDIDPDMPWSHQKRLAKVAVLPQDAPKRLSFGQYMLSLRHTPDWYWRRVIWTDICNTILPRTERRSEEMTMSRKSKRQWGSKGTRNQSDSLQGAPENKKLKSFGSIRVYWAPVLCRGKVHLEILGDKFPGETAEGASQLVAKVRKAVNIRFQGDDKPVTIFTDKGRGFFDGRTGAITKEYKEALARHDFKAYYPSKSDQPGKLSEVMLHGTVVAWVRNREKVTLPREPWRETREEFAVRLRGICDYINQHYDVEGVSNSFPKRLELLVEKKGDRINK